MFRPSELERMPIPIEQRMAELEMRIMEDIIRRIRINDEITRSADWQVYRLVQMGQSTEYIQKQIKEALKLTDEEIDSLYDGAIQSGYARDKKLYEAVGKEFIPFKENKELQELIQSVIMQTKSEMENITQTLGFTIDMGGKQVIAPLGQYLQQVLDTAVMEVNTGTFDYDSSLKKVVKEMTKSGLRRVDYSTGWSNRIDVAVRRALMTGVTQVTSHINERNADELGTDKFEVSWHATARPEHQVWQGRIYTRKELVEICGLGTGPGLMGWNCYHSYYPFIEGVSERQWTDEQLDRMNAEENKPKLYNGKEYTSYEATQRQRYMETLMRAQRQKIKLIKSGGGSEEDLQEFLIDYQDTMRKYKLFSKQMGLPQQMERIYIDGLGRVSPGKLTNLVEKAQKDAIMKIRNVIKSDSQIKTIEIRQQNKHIVGTTRYNQYVDTYNSKNQYGPSRLDISIEQAQILVDKYHGTGKIKLTKKGWNNEEVILDNDITVGTAVNNLTGVEADTTVFKIKYGPNGTHIVPDYPSKKRGEK